MRELPAGWVETSLVDIASIAMGQSPDSRSYNAEGRGLPFFQGKAEFGKLYPTIRKWCSEPLKVAEKDDILLSVRAPVGPTNLAPEKCCIGRGLAAIRAYSPTSQKYLLYQLRGIEEWLSKQGTGTTFTAISGDFIRELNINLAPAAEQKRIADKLDALLARVDACRRQLDRVPALIKRFRQAVLAAATAGDLTADWRDNDETDWETTTVDAIAFVGTGTTPSRSNPAFYTTNGIPWITSAATGQPFITKAQEFVTPAALESGRLKIYPFGTLLVAMYGEGKTRGQVSELAMAATINQACAAIVVDETKAMRKFVKLTLQANYLEMRDLAEGGNQPNLNISKIKNFELPLPSLLEQAEIVKRVEALFAFADRLEARYHAGRKQADQLTPALLAKAFRGELVPQDPNDEPASALLDRIRADRATQGALFAGAPKRKRKS